MDPSPEATTSPPPNPKRRRRRKHYPEMVPTPRLIRPHARPSPAHHPPLYDEALMDRIVEMQINGQDPPLKRRRGRPPSSSASSLPPPDLDALIALSVGFPSDSLTEEELSADVVPSLDLQPQYLAIRNRLLATWRSNVSMFLRPDRVPPPDDPAHLPLLHSAHSFLLRHGYINFGLSPDIRLSGWWAPPDPAPASPTAIIVGAGLAGLAAARQLASLGFKLAILEGRRRPGGRVLTRKMRHNGCHVSAAVDLGGSVLTGINGNPLGVLARQLGFPLHKVRDNCPLYLPDGRSVDPAVDTCVEAVFNQLLDKVCQLRRKVVEEIRVVDVPLGTALEAFREAYGVAEGREERMLLNWHLANLEYANATMLSNLSMAYWDQDDPYEMGGDHCFIPGGNGRFIRALAEDLPIIYGQTVNRIQYGCDGVMVYTNGRMFRGDVVLCTVPLGVLKKGCVEFVPELPEEKREAIKRLGFGLLNKVAMLFPYDFWGGGIDTFGHLTEDSEDRGEFFLFYSYSSVSGGPLLVALVAGHAAIKFENVMPMEPVEKVLGVLKGIFAPKGIQVPDPIQVICTRWGADRFAYGSYSYVAVGASGDDYDILAESVGDGRVFFAGEATNRRYPATMHGAFLSGLREAAKMARTCKRRAGANAKMEKLVHKDEDVDLDELFRRPDATFGEISVLYNPSGPDALLRVVIDDDKVGSGSSVLYGLFQKKDVTELQAIEGDENRVKALLENYNTKLVERKCLGSSVEALVEHIMAAKSRSNGSRNIELVNGHNHG